MMLLLHCIQAQKQRSSHGAFRFVSFFIQVRYTNPPEIWNLGDGFAASEKKISQHEFTYECSIYLFIFICFFFFGWSRSVRFFSLDFAWLSIHFLWVCVFFFKLFHWWHINHKADDMNRWSKIYAYKNLISLILV